ncbi:MAG: DEAD/DEAH box helicase [Burkholderiaceae bacterium]|nr:DEAD/DEAH box helicase [Burkholderiaceae bacterium]
MKEFSNRPPRSGGKPRFSRAPRDFTPKAPKRDLVDIANAQAFSDLGLATELVQAVADLGFTQPTSVQLAAIPRSLNREAGEFTDLLVSSQTGSGKTAAFLLPVLHTILGQQHAERAIETARAESEKIAREAALADGGEASAELLVEGDKPKAKDKDKDSKKPRSFDPATPGALILCPTRELAQQVATDAIDLVAHCRGLRVASVVGGTSYIHQLAGLRNANIVVATPGRLLDLQRSGQIRLDKVQYLVVDEADRMLDLGFAEDLAEVHDLTAKRDQTMMFSATFAPRVQQLAMRVMRKTERIELATPEQQHVNIEQRLYWADHSHHKRQLLDHFLRDTSIKQAIVFASTQVECDSLAEDLQQDGFSAVALHGALSQSVRNRRLQALRGGEVQVLVATDVAARGIDVPTITHVFNYGLPMKAEDYTHRIGRTGRAGREGLAITLAEFRDQRRIYAIESFTRSRFKEHTVDGMEPSRRPSFGSGERRANGGGGGGGFAGRGRPRDGGAPSFGGNRPSFAGRGDDRRGGGGGGFGGPRGSRDGFKPAGEFRGAPRGDSFAPRGDDRARPDTRGDNRFDPRFDARSESRPESRPESRFEPRGEFRGGPRHGDARRGDARPEGRGDARGEGRFERSPRPEGRSFAGHGGERRPAAPARARR